MKKMSIKLVILATLLTGCAETTSYIEVPTEERGITCTAYDLIGLSPTTMLDADTLQPQLLIGSVKVAEISNYETPNTEIMPMLTGTGLSALRENFMLKCTGTLIVPTAAVYKFYLTNDDGAMLYIGGTKVVANDGQHATSTKSASISLQAGTYPLKVLYYNVSGQKSLSMSWSFLTQPTSIISSEFFVK